MREAAEIALLVCFATVSCCALGMVYKGYTLGLNTGPGL